MNKPVVFRLDRWLANSGTQSRKDVKQLIRKGKVTVNGAVVKRPETKVAETDLVEVEGVPLTLTRYVYYMMNKPVGVVSATQDQQMETVLDLLPEELYRPGLFPVGRLDRDAHGLLIISNDGAFAHRVLSPKSKVPKTYLVHLNKPFDLETVTEEFQRGVPIGEGEYTSPATLELIQMEPEPQVYVTIYEGMYHQVKRMFSIFGLEVTQLQRVGMGQLDLDPSLGMGEVRVLSETEKSHILMIT